MVLKLRHHVEDVVLVLHAMYILKEKQAGQLNLMDDDEQSMLDQAFDAAKNFQD